MTFSLLLAVAPAHAYDQPVVSFSVSQEALDTATDMVSELALSFDIEKNLDFGEVSCWNKVGISNLNISVPLDGVSATLHPDYLTVVVDLGDIRGEQWDIYARDGSDNDNCETIEADLEWISFVGGQIEADLKLRAKDGELDVELVNTPRLYGTLDMDIEWQPQWAESLGFDWDLWPDDWFMDLINDYLLDLAIEMAAEAVPDLLAGNLPELAFETEVGAFDIGASLVSLQHDMSALRVTGDVDVSWTGEPQCDTFQAADPGGRDPGVMIGEHDVGFGTTEAFLNRLAWRAWSQGLMCLDAHGVDEIVRELVPGAADTLSDFDVAVQLREPPVVGFDAGAVAASVHGLRLDLMGQHQQDAVHLLDVELDLDVELGTRIDEDLSMIVIDLEHLDLGIDVKETSHLLSQEEGAEDEFEAFLERFTPTIVEAKLKDLAVAPTVFPIADLFVVRLAQLDFTAGAFAAAVDLYASDDPAVDGEAPETWASIVDATDSSIFVQLGGDDDRDGDLAWRYRLDDEAWSPWTLDETVEIMVAEAGDHTLEVAARDGWWNEDDSPHAEVFDRDEVYAELSDEPFGCASAPAGAAWLLVLAGAAGARRRRS